MTDERCKQIMEQLGMPESRSLMQALFQVANETEQEVRKKLTSDNSNYAVSPKLPPKKCNHIQPIQDYAKQLGYTACPVCGGNFA